MGIAVDEYKSRDESLPIQIEWKPFMIDPGTKTQGEEYLAYNQRRWGSDGWTHSLKREGKKIGAPFANWYVEVFLDSVSLNTTEYLWCATTKLIFLTSLYLSAIIRKWWPNTFKAHQLVAYFAQKKKNGEDSTSHSNRALFEALYEEGKNLSSIDTLVQVAVEKLGLPVEEQDDLRSFLETDRAGQDVMRDIEEGRQKYRISGVPFFVIETSPRGPGQRPYGFSGAQPPSTFLEIFEELAE